ncbi:MAG: hypothetical protein M1839_006416 [Geoglossum umbratile]|nr:MAG: hypothetical protein M1839_006416 [Geoglossum umbratile]
MPSRRIAGLPSVRKQHLLVEFASLRYASPQGVYVGLSPDDHTLWSGVIFVRKGPYSPAILRFQISFPADYPSLPPLVTFSTDIFHPLLTPLTTYTYTTGSSETDTVSATDGERLPPGGFSLRHGFPNWFGRAQRIVLGSATSSRNASGTIPSRKPDLTGGSSLLNEPATPIGSVLSPSMSGGSSRASMTPESRFSGSPGSIASPRVDEVSTVEVLRYIRSTFDDETILDSIPLEAAGNPGAWHAWRAHRLASRPASLSRSLRAAEDGGLSDGIDPGGAAPAENHRLAGGWSSRRPGEWNWEGVWEERVRKGIEGSLAEPVLYGNAGVGDDLVCSQLPRLSVFAYVLRMILTGMNEIRFLNMDTDTTEAVKENIRRSVESATVK